MTVAVSATAPCRTAPDFAAGEQLAKAATVGQSGSSPPGRDIQLIDAVSHCVTAASISRRSTRVEAGIGRSARSGQIEPQSPGSPRIEGQQRVHQDCASAGERENDWRAADGCAGVDHQIG